MVSAPPLTMAHPDDNLNEMIQQRDESRNWIRDSYWASWEQVKKDYSCVVDARKDADGNEDPDKTHIGMPDTFALVNRRTARVTAQIPNIGFIADGNRDEVVEQAVASKIMSDWDNGGVQRWQKKHVRQAELLGWSVRGWWWEVSEFQRHRGIDVSGGIRPEDIEIVATTYKIDPQVLQSEPAVLSVLMQKFGRRGLLDVRYDYKAYEGPRSEVLFAGDCYPEPFFDSIQTSGYFIVELRRNKEWLEKLAKRFPQFAPGVEQLLKDSPKGSSGRQTGRSEGDDLRDRMRSVVGLPTQTSGFYERDSAGTKLWSIMARWTPGVRPKVAYVGERSVWLGEMDSPYDLDGKIPFTELILIDDILGGIGDSVARITAGLQSMHNIATNRRFDLYRHITQPLLGTSDRAIYDNPEVLRRDLMRLVHMRGGPNSIWSINDQQSMAAMAASMGEESTIQRMFQVAGGDSNLSMGANVDPAQLRTATGAKIMQAGADILSKDQVDMFHESSVKPDVEMCYLLNRSEMADAVEIDASKYQRNYNPNSDDRKERWIKAEPMHFQVDGKLTVELGSTMADDEEAKVAKSTNLFTMLSQSPFINQETLARDLLIAHGKGPRLAEYMQQQQPPPPVPPIKGSLSVSVDMEKTDLATQRAILSLAGVAPELIEQMQQQVMAQANEQNGPPPEQMPPGIPTDPEQMPMEQQPMDEMPMDEMPMDQAQSEQMSLGEPV